MNPEYCRHLTPSQCREEDKAHRRKRSQQRRERLERKRQRQLNIHTGTNLRALVLLVRFKDHLDRTLPPRSYFEELCNGQNDTPASMFSDTSASFSIRRYFQLQSYGQYQIECEVMDWYTTNNTEAHFAAGQDGMLGSLRSADFFVPALDHLDRVALLDWDRFDRNRDGNIDAVLVLHSGFASEAGFGTACNANTPENRIRSQGYVSSLEGSWTSLNPKSASRVRLDGYAVASAFSGVCDTEQSAQIGVMTHEWLHTFGALDVYDNYFSAKPGIYGGLGSFDIMANPFGPRGDSSLPGSMSPFSRELCGWIEPTEIKTNGVYRIRASNLFPDAYVIKSGFPDNEFLLIENRQPIEFDGLLFGNGGLLIYHVDNDKNLQQDRGYPGQFGWPTNGNHYRVALLQADGQYHLEQGVNNGDLGDIWTQGMTLGPGNGRIFPNTDSYQNRQITRTGILISEISASGLNMTFRVSGINDGGITDPTPKSTDSPVAFQAEPPSPSPTMLPNWPPSPVPATQPDTAVGPPSPAPSTQPDSAATGGGLWNGAVLLVSVLMAVFACVA